MFEPLKPESLKSEYLEIIERMDKLVQDGGLSDFDRTTLLETANDVIKVIAKKYQNAVKGVGKVMGGALKIPLQKRLEITPFLKRNSKSRDIATPRKPHFSICPYALQTSSGFPIIRITPFSIQTTVSQFLRIKSEECDTISTVAPL